LPFKNKTKKLFLFFICCQLGRSKIEKERKEKTREEERKVREKHERKVREKHPRKKKKVKE
jgi:hypothetical protein